jgi:hypothetical protein
MLVTGLSLKRAKNPCNELLWRVELEFLLLPPLSPGLIRKLEFEQVMLTASNFHHPLTVAVEVKAVLPLSSDKRQ